jgi:hypothetical protein
MKRMPRDFRPLCSADNSEATGDGDSDLFRKEGKAASKVCVEEILVTSQIRTIVECRDHFSNRIR